MTILVAAIAMIWPVPTTEFVNLTFQSSKPVRITHHHKHHHRKPAPPPPMNHALASYYALHGGGACGVGDVQSGYRFAHLSMSCGTRIRFCYRTCVIAVMSDRGPYVSGRTFDLNVNLRYALGCPDLCYLRWAYAQ